jgi:murein L,D-transpeptidase YafK
LNSTPRAIRVLLASFAIASAIALAGCETEGTGQIPGRAMAPLSQDMQAEIQRKSMPVESPILVRIFKEEAELEVWKQDSTGHFALLKTYPICRWSGDLGPKVKEGDRQAPEGFYQITPGLMNPNSNYYLAFNLGFPNTYDKANDRSGAFLMVHGDCSSRGCYAMTDEQIGEIFALGRDSFQGGQKSFQVQAYPFHMTALNMVKHRNSPHMAFWRMIKQGYDHFEVTRQEPRVDVCDKHYVFNAESPNGAPLSFNSRGRCPAYQLGPEVASALQSKQAQDDQQFAELVARGTPTTPFRNGVDGGMHPTFIAKLKPKRLLDGVFGETKVVGAQPGAMGNNVNPPADVAQEMATSSVPFNDAPKAVASSPPPPAAAAPRTASAAPPPAPEAAKPSTLARVGQFFGLRTADASATEKPAAAPPPAKPVAETKPKPALKPVQTAQPAPQPRQQVAQQAPAAEPAPASTPPVMNGAVAPLPTSSFDSRWAPAR